MREIFFDEKLGETRRGCKPHGQRWGASRTGRDGVGAVGVVGIPPNPRRGTSRKGAAEGVAHRGDFWGEARRDSEGVRATRAGMGCERWELWERWEG